MLSTFHEKMQRGLELSHKRSRKAKQHQPFNSRLSVGIGKIKKPSSY